MKSIEKLRRWSCHLDIQKIADEIEAEIEENYMELPKDADGVPIHVGDKMYRESGTYTYTVHFVGEGSYVPVCPVTYHIAAVYRHVKPDPLKELLMEFVEEVRKENVEKAHLAEHVFDEYAERARELMEVDA